MVKKPNKRRVTNQQQPPIDIENNVYIGMNAIIMGGVRIGRGTVIGAGADVTKNVPANSVAVGVPAKVVRQRIQNFAGETCSL